MAHSKGGMKRLMTRLGLWIVIFLFAFGLVGGTVMFIASTGKFPPRPDRELDALMAAKGVNAPTAILVMRYQNVIYKKAWPEDVSPDRIFPLGDLVEPWLAEAVMMLADRGKVDLDAPMASYLPGEPELDQTKSVASFLDHTASFEMGAGDPIQMRTAQNYLWLRRLIEVASGDSVEEFIHRDVHNVLDMTSTEYQNNGSGDGVGVWESTLEDMSTWAKTLNSNRLVDLKTYLRGHTPITLKTGEKAPFGFGWRLEPWNGMRLEQASNFENSANFSITRLPQRNFVVLVCSEMPSTELDSAELGREIARIYLEREFAAPYRRDVSNQTD